MGASWYGAPTAALPPYTAIDLPNPSKAPVDGGARMRSCSPVAASNTYTSPVRVPALKAAVAPTKARPSLRAVDMPKYWAGAGMDESSLKVCRPVVRSKRKAAPASTKSVSSA